MAPFHGRGSTAPRLQSHYEEAVYFLPILLLQTIFVIHSQTWGQSTLTHNGVLSMDPPS